MDERLQAWEVWLVGQENATRIEANSVYIREDGRLVFWKDGIAAAFRAEAWNMVRRVDVALEEVKQP